MSKNTSFTKLFFKGIIAIGKETPTPYLIESVLYKSPKLFLLLMITKVSFSVGAKSMFSTAVKGFEFISYSLSDKNSFIFVGSAGFKVFK